MMQVATARPVLNGLVAPPPRRLSWKPWGTGALAMSPKPDEPSGHPLEAEEVQKFVTAIEESTRATEQGVSRFIEPAPGTLRRAISKRHHIVFGRRGSGKTSLLRKAAAELTIDRRPIAFIDLEPFKGHTYPDVLLSVLIDTFSAFATWLREAGRSPASRTSFWQRLFGTKPKRAPLNKEGTARLVSTLEEQVVQLNELLHSHDKARIKKVEREDQVSDQATKASAGVKAGPAGISGDLTESLRAGESSEVTEEFRRSKVDFLLRHILDYQRIFRQMGELSGGDSFLFLDDLYHINRRDQPDLIDYFHRIAKNNRLWMKIGTIRHRTDWYRHGDPPIGMKLGDEADDIDLDLTLEKYSLTKTFLFKVLGTFADESGVSLDSLLAAGARDRLVLASGGVARDFLSIVRRSIDIARERPLEHPRGAKIGAEDVNRASGEHDQTKRDELRRDTDDERAQIEAALGKIVHFCTEITLSNCFLVERDRHEAYIQMIAELVDMRLIHLIRSRISVGHRKGQAFLAYMLDLSQYTGDRKKRDLTMIPFWEPDGEDQLRLAKYIYDPEVNEQSSAGS
jgi:Cdc6-like AAA superfamily ATPase